MRTILLKDFKAIIKEASEFVLSAEKHNAPTVHANGVLGLLFEEPSTRTRFSSASAASRLGIDVIYSDSMEKTSMAKGETWIDTSKVISNYFDVIGIRSKSPGLPGIISAFSGVPVINLGDGNNEHPTQALSTMVSIYQFFDRLKDIDITIWGDLEMGRVPHSVFLAAVLADLRITLVPACGYRMPEKYINLAKSLNKNLNIDTTENLNDREEIDVLYLTREQSERRKDPYQTSDYSISNQMIQKAKLVLHPLPRSTEISESMWNRRNAEIMKHVRTTYKTRQWVIWKNFVNADSFPLMMSQSKNHNAVCHNELCSRTINELPATEKGINVGKFGSDYYCLWCLNKLRG